MLVHERSLDEYVAPWTPTVPFISITRLEMSNTSRRLHAFVQCLFVHGLLLLTRHKLWCLLFRKLLVGGGAHVHAHVWRHVLGQSREAF